MSLADGGGHGPFQAYPVLLQQQSSPFAMLGNLIGFRSFIIADDEKGEFTYYKGTRQLQLY
jgi:hypothetical protein